MARTAKKAAKRKARSNAKVTKSAKRSPPKATLKSGPSAKPFVAAKLKSGGAKPGSRVGTNGMPAKREDLGAPASVAIDRLPEPHRTIARATDAMIRSVVKDCTGLVKWGNACYYRPRWHGSPEPCPDGVDQRPVAFAVLYQTKRGVNLGIPGANLPDPQGLLEGEGKLMRHIKLHDGQLAKSAAVKSLVKGAVAIGFKGM